MRRLVLEISIKFEKNPLLKNIKSYETLRLLRFDQEEFAAIVKVEYKDPSIKMENILLNDVDTKKTKIQLLEQDKKGAFIYFIGGKPRQNSKEQTFMTVGGYLSTPFEIRNDKIKIAFLGDGKKVKNFLEHLDKMGLRYKVVSLTDAKFSPESPLNWLTEKQRVVIVSAFEHGYYETPRRINSQELAKKFNLKSSTLVEHRRKAEQRLLTQIIKKA
jgi:predicted DNA binding protein